MLRLESQKGSWWKWQLHHRSIDSDSTLLSQSSKYRRRCSSASKGSRGQNSYLIQSWKVSKAGRRRSCTSERCCAADSYPNTLSYASKNHRRHLSTPKRIHDSYLTSAPSSSTRNRRQHRSSASKHSRNSSLDSARWSKAPRDRRLFFANSEV